MSTAWLEGKHGFFLGSQAFLLENDREIASNWASKHVVDNPALSWILGRFVESDRANSNRQLFALEGLQMARPTIQHAPMNMNHASRRVVGAYVAAEMIYPTGDVADASIDPEQLKALERAGVQLNPFIEALGVFWRHYFPDEFSLVQAAHAEGRLYYSMECIPREIQCAGEGGCGETYPYVGRNDASYCAHLNETTSDKLLLHPHFTGGAILVPPTRPGWAHADVHSLVAAHADLAEKIYENVKDEMPHLEAKDWESVMGQLLLLAR